MTKTPDSHSLGLMSMKERAALINGKLNTRSEPGGGTLVTLSVSCIGGGI